MCVEWRQIRCSFKRKRLIDKQTRGNVSAHSRTTTRKLQTIKVEIKTRDFHTEANNFGRSMWTSNLKGKILVARLWPTTIDCNSRKGTNYCVAFTHEKTMMGCKSTRTRFLWRRSVLHSLFATKTNLFHCPFRIYRHCFLDNTKWKEKKLIYH